MAKSEFRVENAYRYNRTNATRWIISHIARYWWFALAAVILSITNVAGQATTAYYFGEAFDAINQNQPDLDRLKTITLYLFGLGIIYGLSQWGRNVSMELLAQRTERDTREELYISLLGKSQTFHDRQRVGDIMSRATDDVRQLNFMLNPGIMLLLGSGVFLIAPIVSIGKMEPRLLPMPLIFLGLFVVALWHYTRRLNPVAQESRASFGMMNAGLQETISGIEVVKSSAQEAQEHQKFMKHASDYRKWFVRQGEIEALYLPMLILTICIALGFLQAIWLYRDGEIQAGTIIAFLVMFRLFFFPTFISIFTFSLVQMGYAGAGRILALIKDETDLDENPKGYRGEMMGDITFENVSFGYEGVNKQVIQGVSFHVKAGQTVAIVGQTGSGKSTLTKLVNRIYDASQGSVLIDGIDVRDWSLDSLRSQISTIEQDIFLFSRSIADNIAFGDQSASQEVVQRASRDSQSFDFIENFESGFETQVGERGVTLSGGQRQRIALARAFLTNPRILVLDDSTSAIDSATEDDIQKAIRRAQEGRTVLLITHRLSQIRWADLILVMKKGQIVAQGSHEHLLDTSDDYRRIFARYMDLNERSASQPVS